MADHKITDFVDQSAIDGLRRLKDELLTAKDTYIQTATELAKGLKVSVDGLDQLEKLTTQVSNLQRQAAEATQKHSTALEEQGKIVANTTNTISRQLMEQERVNKTSREAYTEQEKVKQLLDHFHDTYENQVQSLVRINSQLAANSKAQKDNEKALAQGRMTMAQFQAAQTDLIAQHRSLTQQKRTLTQIMAAEEKANQSVEGSYVHMSQQLELLKKAYKDLSEEGRNSDFGKELEEAIQNLDAHLKDTAADMGEFQRNVGNYAIAGQNGIVTTESLIAVINQQAVTMKDVADQTKILIEAKGMLDTTDANYGATVDAINDKLAENRQRLTDVSDIMNTQAISVAEAEAQNQRLTEALKNVDLTSDDAQSTIESLNAKIAENNAIIQENSAGSQSIKKDLKELVLEIATLTIQYQSLSEEEQNSADGQALADHIRDLTERAGQLKDAIADTNQAITNAASDTRGFDQLGGTIQLAIDGFGLATGAAEMLGISSEDLATIQTKLQAAIAASNAMQSIQNTLQAQSAVMQGVNLAQTKLRTVAENLHTAAQGKGVIATTALTVAQWAFNAAASANPIGLLIVAIVAAIAAVWGLVKAFQAFFGPSDEALQKYQDQKKALEDLCEANDKLIDRMKARGATEAELLNQSLLNKQAERDAASALFEQAKELYDEDEDEYKEALEAKKKADEEFAQSKEDGLNYLLGVIHEAEEEEKKQRLGTYEYKRQLIQAELQQQKAIAATLLAQEKITRQVYENLCASLDKAAQLKIDAVNADEEKANNKPKTVGGGGSGRSSGGGSGTNDVQKAADELKKAVRAGEDGLLQLITDSLERQRQAEVNSYNRRIDDLNAEYEKRKKLLAKNKSGLQQLEEAHNRELEGLAAEHAKKLEDIEISRMERFNKAEADFIDSHLNAVEKGSAEELEWRLKDVENQRSAELLAIHKAEQAHTLTTEQANEMRANLVLKYARLETEAKEQFANEQIQKAQEKYAAEAVIADNAYNQTLNKLNAKYAEELKAAGNNMALREAITQKHEEEVARLTEIYAQQRAQASVQSLEQLLKNEDMSAEERQQLEDQLAKAKIEAEKAVTDAVIAENQRQVDADTKAFQKRMENVQKWLQVASDGLNAINDLASAIFDAKIERIEAEQESNTEAGEAEQERIAELVEKNVITEEEGEARKRAAADRTQKKEAELEKKKQELKYKQAVWDKANQLAQAGINTAMSITQTAAQLGFPAAIPFIAIAGAMGAIQIATILATPIPKYAKGTKDHPGGLAIVGDGGRQEVVSYGGNMFLSPDTPTLIDMPKGAEVFPDADKLLASNKNLAGAMLQLGDGPQVVVNNDYSDLKREIVFVGQLIKAQTKSHRRSASRINYAQMKAIYEL